MAATFRRITARQLDQLLFQIAFDLDLVRSRRLRFVLDRSQNAFRNQPLADPTNRANADAQSGNDLVIRLVATCGRVRQQEDPGMGELACRTLPNRHHLFQFDSFLSG
jgi:hypothetical protein